MGVNVKNGRNGERLFDGCGDVHRWALTRQVIPTPVSILTMRAPRIFLIRRIGDTVERISAVKALFRRAGLPRCFRRHCGLKNEGRVAGEAESDHHFVNTRDSPDVVTVVIENPETLPEDADFRGIAGAVPVSNHGDVASLTVDI